MGDIAASFPIPDSHASPSDQSCLRDIVERRRQQVVTRLIYIALVVACSVPYAPLPLMASVGFGYICILLWEHYGLRKLPFYADRRADPFILLTMFAGTAMFGFPAVAWSLSGGPGLVCGAFLTSSLVLNNALNARSCRSAFLASSGPFLVYIPAISLIAGGRHLDLGFIGSVFVSGSSMSLCAILLWRDASRIHGSELEALNGLRQRKHELASALEKANAASSAKTDFLANMSHEIRTPLNGVVAVADMLARADLPDRERGMIEIICASGETLQRLLSDILDMSRIESGKIALEAAPFHVGEMVRAVAALSQLKCDEKGVRLTVDVTAEIDRTVVGDLVRVRQIITNLVSNAVKFTDLGEVRINASRTPGGLACFSVSDTGVGFAPEDKAKVLGRFEQADNSITRRFGGTGLGLSICCSLAQLMGGSIDCDSQPGSGSRFWVELPLPLGEAPAAAPGVEEIAGPIVDSLRILLADDHPTNRKVVELMLSDGVANLTCVEDGKKALAAFQDQRFDLILMDMQMPVMDGLTAIREIRRMERDRSLAPTPIIMLTANALPGHVSEAIAAGADLHLAKPFTAEALFTVIAAALPEAPIQAEAEPERLCA